MIPVFDGTVENGRLKITDRRQEFGLYLSKFEKKPVEVIVRKPVKIRSNQQNRYYRGVIVKLIADEMGEIDTELVHNILRYEFLKLRVNFRGKSYIALRSTTSLETLEMEEYLEKCRIWASEQFEGFRIPLPNEVDFENIKVI